MHRIYSSILLQELSIAEMKQKGWWEGAIAKVRKASVSMVITTDFSDFPFMLSTFVLNSVSITSQDSN